MPTKPQVLEQFASDTGRVYQLLYTAGSSSPWTIVVDGEPDTSYDDYSDAMHAWEETLADAEAQ